MNKPMEGMTGSALLDMLVTQIGAALDDDIAEAPRRISQLLAACDDPTSLLSPGQRTPRLETYTRHLLCADPGGRFSVVALVWGPQHRTPVHGHQTWCAYRIVSGFLDEEQYGWDEQTRSASRIRTVTRHRQDTAFGHAGLNQIHRLTNPGPSPAISIHAYGVDATKVATHVNHIVQYA